MGGARGRVPRGVGPCGVLGAVADRVLDVMWGLVRSAREDRPVEITTPYEKPELFADSLAEGQIDHLVA